MKRRKTGHIGKLIEVNLFGNMFRNVIDSPMDFFGVNMLRKGIAGHLCINVCKHKLSKMICMKEDVKPS